MVRHHVATSELEGTSVDVSGVPVVLVRASITDVRGDVAVNASNQGRRLGAGVSDPLELQPSLPLCAGDPAVSFRGAGVSERDTDAPAKASSGRHGPC